MLKTRKLFESFTPYYNVVGPPIVLPPTLRHVCFFSLSCSARFFCFTFLAHQQCISEVVIIHHEGISRRSLLWVFRHFNQRFLIRRHVFPPSRPFSRLLIRTHKAFGGLKHWCPYKTPSPFVMILLSCQKRQWRPEIPIPTVGQPCEGFRGWGHLRRTGQVLTLRSLGRPDPHPGSCHPPRTQSALSTSNVTISLYW